MGFNRFQPLADELYSNFLKKNDVEMSSVQLEKFKYACLKCVVENNDLQMYL